MELLLRLGSYTSLAKFSLAKFFKLSQLYQRRSVLALRMISGERNEMLVYLNTQKTFSGCNCANQGEFDESMAILSMSPCPEPFWSESVIFRVSYLRLTDPRQQPSFVGIACLRFELSRFYVSTVETLAVAVGTRDFPK